MRRLLVNGQPVATAVESLEHMATIRVSEVRGDTIVEEKGVGNTLHKLRDLLRTSFKLAGVEASVEIEKAEQCGACEHWKHELLSRGSCAHEQGPSGAIYEEQAPPGNCPLLNK